MSENINILSSEILEHPEMCYDFEKNKPTSKFTLLMNVIGGEFLYLNPYVSKIEYKRSVLRPDSIVTHVPEWMGYLIMNVKWRKLRIHRFHFYDEWHLARVFAHKCIDESVRRSRDTLLKNFMKRTIKCKNC